MEEHPPPRTNHGHQNLPYERRQDRPVDHPPVPITDWATARPAGPRETPAPDQFRPAHGDATAQIAAAAAAWAAADSQRGYAAAALTVGDFPTAHRAWQDAAHEQATAAYYSAAEVSTEARAEAAATRLSPTGYQPPAQPTHDHAPHRSQARHRSPSQASGPRRTR